MLTISILSSQKAHGVGKYIHNPKTAVLNQFIGLDMYGAARLINYIRQEVVALNPLLNTNHIIKIKENAENDNWGKFNHITAEHPLFSDGII